jgi:outer membrane lipoprotein carrier protein
MASAKYWPHHLANPELTASKTMIKYLFVLLLACAPLLSLAQTSNDVDDLLLALAPITSLQGSFSQKQYGQDNLMVAESSGTFRLLRPGHFTWEIRAPDAQVIIADPEFIWHYDKDLETVTRRPVTSDAEMTPLQILGGDEAALREKFQVQHTAPGTFVLTPNSTDVGFRQLTLYLDKSQITGMEIQDNLDQSVVIKFSELNSSTTLRPSDFAFTPPEGADLFYYDE